MRWRPRSTVPLRIHCRVVVVSAGFHVGPVEVSVVPTFPVPAICGAEVTTGPGAALPTTAELVEVPVPNSAEEPARRR